MSGKRTIRYQFADSAEKILSLPKHIRPPVRYREKHDFKGEGLRDYINELETRMIAHMRKHAPRWVDQETRRVLWRWTKPAPNYPAPSGATPRDVQKEARDYAAALVRERLVAKMNRINDIRVARYLGGHKQVDPLHLIFHDRTTELRKPLKHKQ